MRIHAHTPLSIEGTRRLVEILTGTDPARGLSPPGVCPHHFPTISKAERFIQTMKREWGYAHQWPSSYERTKPLGSWIRTYDRQRLHSSLGNRPPISRVHNVCG